MPDLSQKDSSGTTKVVGADANGDETYYAQVDLIDGVRRLQTTGLVQIEELFGQDNQGDTWFYLGTPQDVGPIVAGDTVRIQIAAGPNPTLFPAIDLTYTVTAGDVAAANPEVAVASGIVTMLNQDATFRDKWRAQRIADNSTVWIGSKEVGEWSERPNSGDFVVTATGTITVLAAFDKIIRRGKSTSLTKDPDDPRLGVLGITGTVAQGAASLGQIYFAQATLNGAGVDPNMNVNGSGTPVVFNVFPLVGTDIYVTEMRFHGSGNGIKYGQFLNINQPLNNGILIEIKSDDDSTAFPVIYATEDFKNRFCTGVQWNLSVQAGGDEFLAVFTPSNPFPIRNQGAFAIDDYIQVTIRDNLGQVSTLELSIDGFTVDI